MSRSIVVIVETIVTSHEALHVPLWYVERLTLQGETILIIMNSMKNTR